jgi:hypothetical protein
MAAVRRLTSLSHQDVWRGLSFWTKLDSTMTGMSP